MLAPESVAIVGASSKQSSLGSVVLKVLDNNGYQGDVYLINPNYDEIEGVRCYASLADLPRSPDLVVMVIGSKAMQASVEMAIEVGAGGVVIFANNYLENDVEPLLLDRLKNLAAKANMPICGGNGMGFYNYDTNTLVSFDFPPQRPRGHVSLIAHSGSVMTYLANTDPRLTYNLVVSPGQEISGSVADYMLYALEQPSTRVIAAFIETIRNPIQFVTALAIARKKQIPVVLVKVGATEKSACMAVSHSGAIAGDDATFQAVCDHYGAIRVADMDEMSATAVVLSIDKNIGQGGLSSLLDSGGLREQMIDLAESRGVNFAELKKDSVAQLREILEHGLAPENPVDAMGAINADVATTYRRCLEILDQDPCTALTSLEFEFRNGFSQYPVLLEVAKQATEKSTKPLLMINSTVNTANDEDASVMAGFGVPVINGVARALTAIGKAFWYRDHVVYAKPKPLPQTPAREKWRSRLLEKSALDETESLQLLCDLGLPVIDFSIAADVDSLRLAANHLEYPLVLKSAKPGLLHKSDVNGVVVGITDQLALLNAYEAISNRLGGRVIVAPMVEDGIELGFGMVNDKQFGPMVMVCAGGVYIEWLEDRQYLLAPCSVEQATEAIQSLTIYNLLSGARGKPPCRVDLAAKALSDFSLVASAFEDEIEEMDANPVIVTEQQCCIVDALIIPCG